MGKLQLDSLEIRNFRAFRHLRIEKLGRVNLIVGKNSVGKSSLLEALSIYANQGSPRAIERLLIRRNELSPRRDRSNAEFQEIDARVEAFTHLFWNRSSQKSSDINIEIGDAGKHASLKIVLEDADPVESEPHQRGGEVQTVHRQTVGVPVLKADFGRDLKVYQLDRIAFDGSVLIHSELIGPYTDNQKEIEPLWDKLFLTDEADEVIRSMRLIAPKIQRVSYVGLNGSMNRVPMAKLSGADKPVTLKSLGEGVVRMFELATALASVAGGWLLIDEIETGLHYSVLTDVWRFIFQTAHRLNVQVFATTHSWDCIEAFQEAAKEDEHEEAMLIRLENRKGDGEVRSRGYSESQLETATRERFEVR